MQTWNPIRVVYPVIAMVLVLSLAGCGGGDADSASSSETATEPTADAGDSTGVAPADDESLEFDNVPEIAGYEITEQNPGSTELYVTLLSDASKESKEQTLQDVANWAQSEGWTALDVDWPSIDLVFEKPGRVYPLKIMVHSMPTGGFEVVVIMPALGDKLGDW